MRIPRFVSFPGFVVFIILFSISITSCVDVKKSLYFVGQKDTLLQQSNIVPESIIQSHDLLSISVSSLNTDATAIFNTPNNSGITTTNAANSNTSSFGYLVGKDGSIQFPVLGKVQAAGLSIDQLRQELTRQLISKKMLVDPLIVVRYLNFKVTVLGEVNKPSVLTVPSEKISLLEAIGQAGDLTIYSNRENVTLIREEKEGKLIKRINLNSSEIFTSPYYYLQSNDVVYVEPNKSKVVTASTSKQWIPTILSALSLLIIILTQAIK